MPSPLRFVVLKGVQGFGDRLQCLLQAIRYAEISRRHLVIDWRDPDWTHDTEQALHTYFSVEGVATFGLREFKAYWHAHAHALSVHPRSWAPVLTEADYPSWIYNDIFSLPGNNAQLNDICTYKAADYEADVVVYPGVGMRTFTYSDLDKIRLSHWVKERIQAFAKAHELTSGNYDAIHLRGGSKAWCGGQVPLQSLDASIRERWPDRNAYLDELWRSYQDVTRDLAARPLLLISDHGPLAEAWQERFHCGRALPNLAGHLLRESGTHKLSAEDFGGDAMGASKEELTIECLRDFVLMLHARKVVGDGVSLFSSMAERCGAAGVRLVELPAASVRE